MQGLKCREWLRVTPGHSAITVHLYAGLSLGLGRFGCFNFGLIRFGFQSQVLGFSCYSFGIRTPLRCKSILVCENTKTELINFHKEFQLKYIDLPHLV